MVNKLQTKCDKVCLRYLIHFFSASLLATFHFFNLPALVLKRTVFDGGVAKQHVKWTSDSRVNGSAVKFYEN